MPELAQGVPLHRTVFRPNEATPMMYRYIPVKDMDTLTISFPLPSMDKAWKTKPCCVIEHVLGHEGTGSLLSLYRRLNLATGLSIGVGEKSDIHWLLGWVNIDIAMYIRV